MTNEVKAGAVLAALLAVAGIALTVASSGGQDSEAARMTLERSASPTGLGEVLGTVTGKPEAAPRATDVSFRCLDRRGRAVTAARHPWPLEKDGEEPVPHIHQAASARELGQIVSCRLGTRPPLTATMPLR